MKLVLHITLTVLTGISLASLLTGCAIPTKEDIARSTTEFNLVAEKAGNEMLLLNIVRASKRRPMYFTSIGKLTGNKTFEYSTGSISIPFGRIGGGLNGSYSIAPTVGYKNSPLFDVTVLNTKEFTNGIMTPVPMETIGYYWSQGWHKEMLLHLFIRRIEIIDPNDPDNPNVYVNYPGNHEKINDFQEQIRIKDWKWDIVVDSDPNTTKIGEVDATEALKLKDLIEVQKAGLRLRPGKDKSKTELCLSQVNYIFKRKPRKPTEPKKPANEAISKTPDDVNSKGNRTFRIGDLPTDEKVDKQHDRIYLRSPEAILYYLGEIVRAENNTEDPNDPNIPKIDVSHDQSGASFARLFYAREVKARKARAYKAKARKARDDDVPPCVSVDYERTTYVIPGDPGGYGKDRSMHVLSLVSQLIGLQKKSEEAPATSVVSVIGR